MRSTIKYILLFLCLVPLELFSQSFFDSIKDTGNNSAGFSGFIRSGAYFNKDGSSIALPVTFADISIRTEAGDGTRYKAYADLRYRYGREYDNPVNSLDLREAWAAWYTPYTEVTIGKQIVKWSHMDFFRLQDEVSPRNNLYRSFDPSDRDQGNMVAVFEFSPHSTVNLQALLIPFHKPSVLYTGFMDMPDIVEIEEYKTGSDRSPSYGIRATLFLRNFSGGISYFDGYSSLPGIKVDTVIMQSGYAGAPLRLEKKAYKTRNLSADIEMVISGYIIRAEALWSKPDEDYRQMEYVSLPGIRWVAGIEHSFGDLQVLAEYSGKYLTDYEQPAFDPVLPDESSFGSLSGLPSDQVYALVKSQISAFNRLYNYQLDEYSHYAAMRIAWERQLSTLRPSLNILYNITAKELMINPLMSIVPSDNLELIVGAEIYTGPDNSLFDMINEKLNAIYTGLRVNF